MLRQKTEILHGATKQFFGTLISFFRSLISFLRSFVSPLREEFSFAPWRFPNSSGGETCSPFDV